MNQNDLTLAMAGLTPNTDTATDSPIDAGLAQMYQTLEQPTIQQPSNPTKIDTLTSAKDMKIQALAMKKDKLLGMSDADTYLTEGFGKIRESLGGVDYGYDAVEIPHGDKTAMDGLSDYSRKPQLELVARKVGKTPDQVTEQDMIDVGNWQQIQKASALAGSPDWEAPFIRGLEEPTNLTGHYKDEKGKYEYIPLDMDITARGVGGRDTYGRLLGEVGDVSGSNATVNALFNPEQNANYKTAVNALTSGQLAEGRQSIADRDAIWNTIQGDSADNRNVLEQGSNFVKAVGQGLIKTGVLDTADFVGEVTGLWDIGTGDEKEAMAKQVTGYNDKYAQKYMKASEAILTANLEDIPEDEKGWFDNAIESISGKDGMLNNINKIVSNLDSKETGELLSNAFANTDTTGYSLGMLVGLVAGTKGAGLGKVATVSGKTTREVIAGIKATDTLTKAEKAVTIGVVYKDAYKNASLLQKSINTVGKNSGLLTINAGQVNDQLDEFKKNTGRDATVDEVAVKYLSNLGGLLIDRAMDVGTIKGVVGKDTINALTNMVKFAPKTASIKIGQDLVKAAGGLVAAGAGEFVTEGLQTAIEEFNKIDYSTDEGMDEFRSKAVDILNGSFAGLGGAVHMGAPAALATSGQSALEILDEKIKFKTDTLDDPNRVNKPIGLDGKYNMWESVGSPDFKVENPKSKEIYAETVAEFVVDLHTNPEAMVKYGYRGKVEDGGKNIGSALQDATDKMAAVYDLTSPKAKEVAKYMLVQKLVNYTRSKSTEKGEYKISPEQQQEMLQEVAEFVKGNKPAEVAFLDMQKEEIKAAFQGNVDVKKADKFMEAYGLDNQTNGQIIADLMTLDDKQYADLQKAVQSMKLMGSSDSVIMEDMSAISEELDKLRNEAKLLGSDEGKTGGDTGTPLKKRKTYQDVANEVRNIGFMTRSGFKKSVRDHSRDIDTTVGVEGMPQEVQDRNIKALDTFVKERGINKVKPKP